MPVQQREYRAGISAGRAEIAGDTVENTGGKILPVRQGFYPAAQEKRRQTQRADSNGKDLCQATFVQMHGCSLCRWLTVPSCLPGMQPVHQSASVPVPWYHGHEQ